MSCLYNYLYAKIDIMHTTGRVAPIGMMFFFKRASLQLTDGGSVTSRDEGYIPFSQAEKTGIAALYDALPTVTTTGIRCALAGFCARNHHRAALRAGSSATGWLAEEGPAGRGEGEQSSPGKERK
jgi:hypothetical protein